MGYDCFTLGENAMTRATALAFATLALLACKPSGNPPQGNVASAAAAAAPQALGYATIASLVRKEPSEAQKVAGPDGKEVANYVSVLQRGEKVAVIETKDDWVKIRASDDKEGWMKSSSVLQGEGITEATVLVAADVFDRPDLLAANAKRKVEPGTLLLVVKSKPPFSEVNVSGSQNAWVLGERLATGEREVSVAKLIEKARWLVRNKKQDDAKQVLSLARDHFAGVPLVDVLAQELGEAPPQTAEGAPSGGMASDQSR
jgi:SH3-like domain-containing protein